MLTVRVYKKILEDCKEPVITQKDLETIDDMNCRIAVQCRLGGQSLEETGQMLWNRVHKKYGVTRERARQWELRGVSIIIRHRSKAKKLRE